MKKILITLLAILLLFLPFIKKQGGEDMAETWVLNETISKGQLGNKTFTVNFTSNGTQFSSIVPSALEESMSYGNTHVFTCPNVWVDNNYRTITFSTAPTGDLLTWLQANGTKQEESSARYFRKTKLKVSNVCQLLDKQDFHNTQTVNGVTFTNNADGTWTINGTATDGLSRAYILTANKTVTTGHKFLLFGNSGNVEVLVGFYSGSDNLFLESNVIYPIVLDNINKYLIFVDVSENETANNVVIKPQLFDLTEMYGVGNEPTSVEQFRQDFPEEIYPYSPKCWVTSYKTRLIAETKNLFDYSEVSGMTFRDGDDASAFLMMNGNSLTNRYGLYGATAYLLPRIRLSAGTYTLSLIARGSGAGKEGVFGYLVFNGEIPEALTRKKVWTSRENRQSFSFTLAEESEIALTIQGYGVPENYTNIDSTFSDIQLERGSTATSYVPHGYLQINKGVKI